MSGDTSVKDKLKQLFRQWDRNKDGVISRGELNEVFTQLNLEQAMIDAMFEAADTNKNGVIDTDEFIDWVFSGEENVENAVIGSLPDIPELVSSGLCGQWRQPSSIESYKLFASGTALYEMTNKLEENDSVRDVKGRGWGSWMLEEAKIVVQAMITQTDIETGGGRPEPSINTFVRPLILEMDVSEFKETYQLGKEDEA
eukprot:gnl/MRDRNA2_/MRDRNA2_131539_c0_seq1.p1 gnl/MRDRNA2_/MRDRNA2_131539_c0~~gnl/MRDRNA2_/MRDRNA2_131539_c0_seq1.p1  ORF type:complete len:199 (-),score=46.18 gnl/MRDRNA2_/MRDRNA2_131539_c0_seq1:11-607(-)